MRQKFWLSLLIVLIVAVLAGLATWPSGPDLSIGSFYRELKIRRGLDLQGGTHLVYELKTEGLDKKDIPNAVESTLKVLERRINFLGVSEPTIQSAEYGGKKAVIVELPGISNIDEAKKTIGQTAQLQFKEQLPDSSEESAAAGGGLGAAPIGDGWKNTELTGQHLVKSGVEFDQTSSKPQITLQFNDKGKELFGEITKRNLQKPLAIFLDEQLLSAPTVQTVITEGRAIITGEFTVKEAKNLSSLLNAGALPVPISVIEERTIGPTLGQEAVEKSLLAGAIGLLLIAIFMISFYRFNGLIAIVALGIYSLISIAIFKLIPITLTLAGIAGFILSIGMAVDANILIFSRMKEELASGKGRGAAIEEGFKRAWLSIRDSNFSSLITCLILYYTTTGLVRGFAVTLAIGIIVSMFSAIFVSKTLLQLTNRFIK